MRAGRMWNDGQGLCSSDPAVFAKRFQFTLHAFFTYCTILGHALFQSDSLKFLAPASSVGHSCGTSQFRDSTPAGHSPLAFGQREIAMEFVDSSLLRSELERVIQVRTGRRVRHLAIEVLPERVVLHGRTTSYYVKQLAQHGVRDLLPHVPLENVIAVEHKVEIQPSRVLT